MSRFAIVGTGLGALLLWSPSASAEGEACLRDSECGGVEWCVEAVCAPSDEEPRACPNGDAESFCEEADVCVDDVCKRDDLVCRNALGECFIADGSGQCVCAHAPGIEWTGEPPDVGSASDDPGGLCFDLLAATCPDAVPEPRCATEAQRSVCEAFVGVENALNGACGGSVHDDPARVAGAVEFCCEEFTELGVAAYRECVLGLDSGDCEGFEACADGEMPADPGATPLDPSETGGAEPAGDDGELEEEPIGCRTGSGGRGVLLWLAAAIALRRRRQYTPRSSSMPG